jgi:hypothetical protein
VRNLNRPTLRSFFASICVSSQVHVVIHRRRERLPLQVRIFAGHDDDAPVVARRLVVLSPFTPGQERLPIATVVAGRT